MFLLTVLDDSQDDSTLTYIQELSLFMLKVQNQHSDHKANISSDGLNVVLRGLSTSPFKIDHDSTLILLDFVRHKIRINGIFIDLPSNSLDQTLNQIRNEVFPNNQKSNLVKLINNESIYNLQRANQFAEFIWWAEKQLFDLMQELPQFTEIRPKFMPINLAVTINLKDLKNNFKLDIGYSLKNNTSPKPHAFLDISPLDESSNNIMLKNGYSHGLKLGYNPIEIEVSSSRLKDYLNNLLKT